MTRRRRQLRLAVPAALLLTAILVAAIIAGATGGASSPPSKLATGHLSANPTTNSSQAAALILHERRAGTLSAPLEDAAAVSLGEGRMVLLGGLDENDTSTAAITVLPAGHVSAGARLPEAQHDAQAAQLGGEVYVFGGGQVSSYDHILRFDPASGNVSLVGHLPQPASDVAVAAIAGTA